jgi:uncharacterized membrane protein YfcA
LTPEFALAAIATLTAGVARGMLGFGATLIVVPCLISIYGPLEAVVIASIIEIPAVISLLPTAIRQADWRQIAPLGIASLTTIPFGAWLLVSIDPELARQSIAIMVIVFAGLLATGWRYDKPPSMALKIGVGFASGLTSGLANIGGPLVVVFLVASRTAAAGLRAGIMAFFSISGFYRIVVYAVAGIYTAPLLLISAGLCVPYLLGIWIGARLFHKVSEKLFFRLAIGLVLAAGLIALVK